MMLLVAPAIPQQNHLIGNEFGTKMFFPGFVFPSTSLQAAFDVDLLAFA